MKTFLKILLILCLCASVRAANQTVTAILTVSTNPHVGSVFSVTGVPVTWTNAAGASSFWVQTTNSTKNATTNLYTKLAGLTFTNINAVAYSNETNLTLYGIYNMPLTITVSGPGGTNWASVVYRTNVSAAAYSLSLPFYTGNITNKHTNIHNDMVDLLNYANATNRFSGFAPVWTNFPHQLRTVNPPMTNMSVFGGTNRPSSFLSTNGGSVNNWASNLLVTNLTGTSLLLTNVSEYSTNGIYTNVVRMNADKVLATNMIAGSGSFSNGYILNALGISGIMGNVTNGIAQSLKLTNASGEIRNSYGSNWIMVDVTVTNLNAPGSGSLSVLVGHTATASGGNSVAIGATAKATNAASSAVGYGAIAGGAASVAFGQDAWALVSGSVAIGQEAQAYSNYSSAIGNQSVVLHDYSTAIGYQSATTSTNQIRLGTASEHVSIPGELRDVKATNMWSTGTNRYDLAVSYSATNITTLANGVNLVDPGFKTYIRVSGPTAAYSLDKLQRGWDGRFIRIQKTDSYTWTINNESGSAGGAATDRIYTGTGATVTITNNPGVAEFTYDPTLTRWVLGYHSN